jgi:hypothetical protein
MGSPLFFPVMLEPDGSPEEWWSSLGSTRFHSHHLGIKGTVAEVINWKGFLTWINHFGSYMKPYETDKKQLSGQLDLQYVNKSFPLELGFSIAMDAGNTIKNNCGFQLWINKKW